MNLHGWLMHVSPGEELAPGVCDMSWKLYQTRREGIRDVPSQIADDWEYKRLDFVLGEDLQDYCGLHGLTAYARTNMPTGCGKCRLGRHILAGDFILCGMLFGETIPFHTEEQAYSIMNWLVSKQEQWNAIYSERQDGEASEEPEASEADAGSWPAGGKARSRLH